MRFFIDKTARKAYFFADNPLESEALIRAKDLLGQFLPQKTTELHAGNEQKNVTTHLEFSDMSARAGTGGKV